MSVTDRIRKQMVQPDGLVAESLSPLATEYAQETAAVNARLQECIALLRRGLRSEAIQRATMKPALIDSAASLDFPELEDWLSILQFYGIPSPELLDHDAVQQIQQAMVEDQSLEQLMRQHRRLAIAKAPLSWRLAILRSLASADSANALWREDQRQWERVRVKEISKELKKAEDDRNVLSVQSLAHELNDSPWEIDTPKDLGKRAKELLDGYTYDEQIGELRQIADRVHASYGENDEQTTSNHRVSWNDICHSLKKPLPEDLSESVAPAFQWLDDRQRESKLASAHAKATTALTAALDSNVSLDQIQLAYQQLVQLQQENDPELIERALARIKSLKLSAARASRNKILVAAASVISIVCIVAVWQWNRAYQVAVSDTVSRLTALLVDKKLEDAESLLKRLEADAPKVLAAPQMSGVVAQVEKARQQETHRSAQANQAIADAHHDDPSKIDILKLVAAERAAVSPSEKEAVQAIRSAWEKHDRKISDDQFESIKKHLDTFAAKLTSFEKIVAHEIPTNELEAMIAAIKALETEYPKGAAQATTQITSHVQKINAMLTSVNQNKQLHQESQLALKRIYEAKDLAAYTAAISNYIESVPAEDSLSKSLATAKAESSFWENVDVWNEFCTDLQKALENQMSVETLENLMKRAATLKSDLSFMPGIKALDNLDTLNKGVEARSQELNSVVEELRNSIVGEMVTIVETRGVADAKGKRMFMNYDTRMQYAQEIGSLKDSSNVSLPVIGDALGAVTQHRFKGKLDIIEEPRSAIRKIINRFENERDALLSDWETQMNDTIKELVNNNRLDTLLKELLLARLVKAYREGSPTTKEVYRELDQELIDSSSRREIWFLEAEFETNLNPKLTQLLQTAVDTPADNSNPMVQSLSDLAKQKLFWVGALLPTDGKNSSPWYQRNDIPNGTVYMLVSTDESHSKFELVEVATFQGGQSQLTIATSKLKAGPPLLWLRAKK